MGIDAFAVDVFDPSDCNWRVPVGTVGYFRDSYQRASLAGWLAANVDPAARGRFGLALFTEPTVPLNSSEWREELLFAATLWATKARALRGRGTVLGSPGVDLEILDEEATAFYIEWTIELLRFAEIVYATGSAVRVFA